MTEKSTASKRGFAAMSPEVRRAIASRGGSSVPREARSFSRQPELARRAGQLGGQASRRNNSRDEREEN